MAEHLPIHALPQPCARFPSATSLLTGFIHAPPRHKLRGYLKSSSFRGGEINHFTVQQVPQFVWRNKEWEEGEGEGAEEMGT